MLCPGSSSNGVHGIHHSLKYLDTQPRAVCYKERRDVQFTMGDLVRLSTENLKIDSSLTRKMAAQFTRPFKVKRVIGRNACELELPQGLKIHPVFLVSLLKPYVDPDAIFTGRRLQQSLPILQEAGEEEFEVEAILNHRRDRRGRLFYFIRWKHCGPEEDKWCPESEVHAPQLIRAYLAAHRSTQ